MANVVIKPEHIMINPVNSELIDKARASNFFEKFIYQKKSEYQTVQVIQNPNGRFLAFDNFSQAGVIQHELYSGNVPYINYFFIASLLNPNIKNVLMLGMGTGRFATSFSELSPELERFDIVDTDKEVYSVAKRFFKFKETPKIKVHIQDGIDFIKNSETKYDLIITDISNNSGIPFDFMTREFLVEMSSLLTENGISISHVFSSYEFNSDKNVVFKSTLKTYESVFEDIMIIPTIYGDYLANKILFDTEGKAFDLISSLLFSSKNKINVSKEELINRAKELQKNANIEDIQKLDKFAEDLLTEEINTDKFKPFKEEYKNDPNFNEGNLLEYLKV